MALPSAQLGSLPSLNVPSYIPVIQVQKERKLRDQVLAQLATQLIGQAVGAGVGNLMERDYSAEVGETPSTGFDKLFHGAKNDEKTAAQKREITAREKLQKEGIAADAKREHGRQLFDIKKDTFQEKQRIATMEKGLEADEIKERMDYDRLMAELQSRENQQSQGIRAQSLRDQIDALKADKRLDKQLGAEKDLNTARTKNLQADTAAREETNRIMRGQREQSDAAKRQHDVQTNLQDTNRYPTANQVMSRSQTSRSTPAVDLFSGRMTPPKPTTGVSQPQVNLQPTKLQPTIEQVMSRLQERVATGDLPPGVAPEDVERAAALIANAPKTSKQHPDLEAAKHIVLKWLENNGIGQPWSEDNLQLRKLISPVQ